MSTNDQAMPSPTEIVIKLKNGLRVAGKSWGNPSCPTKVMALHGWMDNSGTHDSVAPHLAKAGMNVVAIDFIGHGRSQHVPPETEPFFLNYVLQVIDTAYALGWESFHIFAHSMGAGVASLVASVAPEMVRSMVLFDALGPISSKVSSAKQLEDAIRDRRQYLNRAIKLYPSLEACISKLRENNTDIAEHTARAIVSRGTIQVEGGYQFCHDPRLLAKSMTVFREPDVLDYLQRIRCPVLVIWAQETIDRYKMNPNIKSPLSPALAGVLGQAAPSASPKGSSNSSSLPLPSSAPVIDPTLTVAGPEISVPCQPPPVDTTSQRPEIENPRNAPKPASSSAPALGFMAVTMDCRMAEIQHLTKVVVPGSHHVHSDNPEVVLPYVIPFLLPQKAKL
jgi:pimeloyl-ACP methyl ester carboxylesterase